MKFHGYGAAGLLSAFVLGGCTGLIGEPGDDSQGTGGSAGNSQALECVPGSPDPGPTPLRRLTPEQWRNTLAALFGDGIDPGSDFPKTSIKSGFRTYADSNIVTAAGADGIRLSAEHVARQIEADVPSLLGCDPVVGGDTCVDGFITSFGQRAYRRPLLAAERARLESVYDTALADGFSASEAIGMLLEVILQSPQFLYRAEIANPSDAAPGTVVRVDDWEMASRLSYLIWDSMPDDELMSLAAAGKLREKAEVEAQARRLLDDPRARPALGRFFEDWLELYRLDLAPKDQSVFQEYDSALDQALRAELGQTAAHVIWEMDGLLETLLSAPVAVVNGPLAALYGLSAPSASGFEPVELDPARRAGILTSASFLAAHANTQTTNPVARGAFVRNQLLCQVLVPPEGLVITPLSPDPNRSKREQLAQHRDDPACASCHALMDPIGFGFENYDAIGRWRDTEENGMAVVAEGELLDAGDATGAFSGPIELVQRLAGSEIVQACVALQTFRFAAGREETKADGCSVKDARERFRDSGGSLEELIVGLTQTDAFFHRRIQEALP